MNTQEENRYLIKVETILSKDIELTGYKQKLDELCKKLLSNKVILAWIMKSCMKEYKDYEVCEIALKYIEGTPEVAKVAVHADENVNINNSNDFSGRIVGLNTEDNTITEGRITYDIRFAAIIPSTEERIKLIINIEAQDDFYPGYPLVKRGFYYGCRLVSSQYGTEFKNSHYEAIKKVYSIWICTNPPDYRKNTITRYFMCEENIVGVGKEERLNYDLLNLIMICLGGSGHKNYYGILKLLDVLFSMNISVMEKKRILQAEFGLEMTEELESEVQDMCDFSDGVEKRGYERGIAEGIVKSIKNLMNTMGYTVEQAMDVLLIPEKEREKYMKIIR